MQNVGEKKVRLDADEVALIVEGLEAGAREYMRMSLDARRLGFAPQSSDLMAKASAFGALASQARSAGIDRITVRHS